MIRIHLSMQEELVDDLTNYANLYYKGNLSETIRTICNKYLSDNKTEKNNKILDKNLDYIKYSIGYLKKLNESFYRNSNPIDYEKFINNQKRKMLDD